ncbi:MAG: GNAT family N-acetyltransferase [Cellulosilyticaceae bacterium]
MEVEGERLILRTFTRSEYHTFYRNYISDPIMDPKPYHYDYQKVDESYTYRMDRASWYPIAGIFLKDGTPIGEMQFKRVDQEKKQCELGMILANNTFKGQGYGTEATKLAIRYAFNVLKLKTIYLDTMGANIRAQKICKRLGFEFISKEERYYDMEGRLEDKLNYIIRNPAL